jgi:hypothetical protein
VIAATSSRATRSGENAVAYGGIALFAESSTHKYYDEIERLEATDQEGGEENAAAETRRQARQESSRLSE